MLAPALLVAGHLQGAAAGFLIGSGYRWYPIPARPPAAAETPVARRLQDLEHLRRELPRLHADLFHQLAREDFHRRLDSLAERARSATDVEHAVGIAQAVAAAGDAHTSCEPWWSLGCRRVPIVLEWLQGEACIALAPTAHPDAAGRRLIALGEVAAAELLERVATVVARENRAWLEHVAPKVVQQAQELEEGAVYGRYSPCALELGLRAQARELFALLDARRDLRLVLDLRSNTGGSTLPFERFVLPGIVERPWPARRDRLAVLVDRATSPRRRTSRCASRSMRRRRWWASRPAASPTATARCAASGCRAAERRCMTRRAIHGPWRAPIPPASSPTCRRVRRSRTGRCAATGRSGRARPLARVLHELRGETVPGRVWQGVSAGSTKGSRPRTTQWVVRSGRGDLEQVVEDRARRNNAARRGLGRFLPKVHE